MPTYDYVCSACGHRFEEFHSMSQQPLRECPQCHEQTLDRLIGPGAGVIFKGSGFYQTDYKNAGQNGAAKDKGGDQKSGDKGDAPSGGCSPACGTDSAPSGCRMKGEKKTG